MVARKRWDRAKHDFFNFRNAKVTVWYLWPFDKFPLLSGVCSMAHSCSCLSDVLRWWLMAGFLFLHCFLSVLFPSCSKRPGWFFMCKCSYCCIVDGTVATYGLSIFI